MKPMTTELTQTFVREAFDYDPLTGIATWKTRPRHHFDTRHGWVTVNAKRAGKICGCTGRDEGLQIVLQGAPRKLHRMIWLWVYGETPPVIDHINGDRADNRLCNLRKASTSQNRQNSKKRAKASSNFKGVHWTPDRKPWRARIKHNGHSYSLGIFSTEQDAHNAYCAKGRELFGEFFNPGC